MPFLHYETDERRQRMARAITEANRELPERPSRDQLLVKAYLNHKPPLHPRRTLDQYAYHGIDTTARDQDQVVYRWCKRNGFEPKVYMVDQLWLFVLGKGEQSCKSLGRTHAYFFRIRSSNYLFPSTVGTT
jgi:hypothetical protein